MTQRSAGRDPGWWRYDAAARRLTLTLHVQPGASRSAVAGMHADALKVRIAAPASENRANAELIGFISAALHVGKSAIAIRHGATGRRKIVEITGGPDLIGRLNGLL